MLKGVSMVESNRWMLPDGVVELTPPHARRIELLRRKLLDHYYSYGYKQVYPPLIEYLETLFVGVGEDVQLQTIKVADQLTGRTLGFRADITPQVARIAARSGSDTMVQRFCYSETVLNAVPEHLLSARTQLQTGAEIYGHKGIESDTEILSLMIRTLEIGTEKKSASEQSSITVGLGHVGIIQGILDHYEVSDQMKTRLESIFQRKAVPELEEYLETEGAPQQLQSVLVGLIKLHGSHEVLGQAKTLLLDAPKEVLAAIDYLSEIGNYISSCHAGVKIYFDACGFRGYHYHTGLVFAAYLEDLYEPIAQGGRYDAIGSGFGAGQGATGFSMNLLTLARYQEFNGYKLVYAAPSVPDDILSEFRQKGHSIVKDFMAQTNGAEALGCTHQLILRGDQWVLESIDG